jgi:hypothetical protein
MVGLHQPPIPVLPGLQRWCCAPLCAYMRQTEGEQECHDRDDQRQIGEPWRIGRDEWRHGIEHQEDGERSQRNALRQR